MFREKELNYN